LIDNDHVERGLRSYQSQAELFLQGGRYCRRFAGMVSCGGANRDALKHAEGPSLITDGAVLGWQVPDAVMAVKQLMSAGVQFERYEFMKQDELGIWTTPTGAKVAWFKDPDGNILSVSQHP
jgi:hypothetical protein